MAWMLVAGWVLHSLFGPSADSEGGLGTLDVLMSQGVLIVNGYTIEAGATMPDGTIHE